MGFKIGEVNIANKVVLAPMAGVCNIAFRTLAKECGAGLIYAEMVSDKGLQYGNEKTRHMLKMDNTEKPLSMQIFGGDEESLAAAAKIVAKETAADIIDINMGCPVPKITKSEAGARLLLNPERVYEVVKAVVDSVDLPVTVKMRTGWNSKHIFAVENAQAIAAAGAKALAIHGRTREQMYEGQADWNIIAKVKQAVKIPVIGNGDVSCPLSAKAMLDKTGCDAVMIGRASLGNPWLFGRTAHFLESGELLPEPTIKEKMVMCLEHAERLIEVKRTEEQAMSEMRKHAMWYIKGLRNSSTIKKAIVAIKTKKELEILLNSFV